ncbi:MAG: hypothetical protein ACI35O_15890 [Bacillaceae bacterium]
MKLKRIGIFSVVAVATIGTLTMLYSGDKVVVNKKMEFVDYSGDRSALEGVSFENIIKVGQNKYEKVTLLNNAANFKETKYDEKYRADEKVLDNKELFRGKYDPAFYEDEKQMMTVAFNPDFPYSDNTPFVELIKKDKKTGDVSKQKIMLNEVSLNGYIMEEKLIEIKGKLYYVITTDNYGTSERKLGVYLVDQDKLTLSKQVEIAKGDAPVVSDGTYMYTLVSNEKELKLVKMDVAKKQVIEKDITNLKDKVEYVSTAYLAGDTIYIASSMNGTVYGVDINTPSFDEKKVFKPAFTKETSNLSINKMHVKNNRLYVTYYNYSDNGFGVHMESDSIIVAYNLKSGTIAYEGALPTMKNRGVSMDYQMN